MTVARNGAIADLDTQILAAQQLQAQAQGLPTGPTSPLLNAAPETQQLPENFPTAQLPPSGLQNRPLTGDETVRLAPYVPAVGPNELAPPPPRSSQGARAQAEREARQQETLQQRLARQRTRVALQGVQFGQSLNRFIAGSNRTLGSVPTPGTIWTPFWILVFLFLVLIPINGHTRLNWFWLALIGHASVGVLNNVGNNTNIVGSASQGTPKITTLPQINTPPSNTPSFTPPAIIPFSGGYLININSGTEPV